MFSVLYVTLGLLVVSTREKVKPLEGTKINKTTSELISKVFCYDWDKCLPLGTETSSNLT